MNFTFEGEVWELLELLGVDDQDDDEVLEEMYEEYAEAPEEEIGTGDGIPVVELD